MDTTTMVNTTASNAPTVDDLCRFFGVSPRTVSGESKAFSILPAIEGRIRASIRAQVEITRKGLQAVIEAEIKGLGLEPDDHSAWKFAAKIADVYEERLVALRIKAIVDGLVSEKPAVMGVDMAAGPDKTGYFVHAGPLTPLQRDEIRRILNPVPQPTQSR